MQLNQARQMQASQDWFTGSPPQPGCAHAKDASRPGSGGTSKSAVSWEPGSGGASVSAWESVQTQKITFALDISNQTASQLDLYCCIRKPIKPLWYLTSLAPAGLHAACEPGCAHPQTNQPPSFAGQRAGRGEGVRSRSRRSVRGGTATPRGGMEYRDKLVLAPMVRVVTSSRPEPLPRFRPLDLPSRLSSGGIRLRD